MGVTWGGIALGRHTIGKTWGGIPLGGGVPLGIHEVAWNCGGMGQHCIVAAYHWEDMGRHTTGMTWGGIALGRHTIEKT